MAAVMVGEARPPDPMLVAVSPDPPHVEEAEEEVTRGEESTVVAAAKEAEVVVLVTDLLLELPEKLACGCNCQGIQRY